MWCPRLSLGPTVFSYIHAGEIRMELTMGQHHHWTNMQKDIKRHYGHCALCQNDKRIFGTVIGPVGAVATTGGLPCVKNLWTILPVSRDESLFQ